MATGNKNENRSANTADTARPAILLFSFCVVTVVSIWLLNTSIYDNRQRYRFGIERLHQLEQMSYRVRLYREKHEALYESLFTAWMGSWGRTTTHNYNFAAIARKFAKEANDIVARNSDIQTRRQQLAMVLKESVCPECDTSFDEEAKKFSHIDSPASWRDVADWIVSGDHGRPILGFQIQFDGVSYTNRRRSLWEPSDQDNILVDRIAAEGDKNVETLLSQEYLQQAQRLADASRASGRIEIILFMQGSLLTFGSGKLDSRDVCFLPCDGRNCV